VGSVRIVGNGIAGIACALRLLQLGIRPIIVSTVAEIPRGAEAVPEPVLHILHQLGLTDALLGAHAERKRGFENHLDAAHPVLLSGWWTHFERCDFLRLALAEAVSRGARVYYARDLRTLAERHDTSVVIDATGRSAILSQPVEVHGSEVASIFRVADGTNGPARVFRSEGHWIYAIPCGANTTLGIVGTPVNEVPISAWESLPVRGPAVRIARRPAFAQRSLRPIQFLRIAIGDAAMAYYPLAGHGIRFALQSAIAAAAVIRTWRVSPAASRVAEQYYDEFVAGCWRRHIAFLDGPPRPPMKAIPSEPIRFTSSTCVVGICRDARIVPEEAIELSDGGLVRWVGGVDLLSLRTLTSVPTPLNELIGRLSVLGLTPAQASQLVEWCLARGVLG